MMAIGKEFVDPAGSRSACGLVGPTRTCLRAGRYALVAVACYGVLASVWNAAGDENRRQTIAAVEALGQARSPSQRIEAIRDLVRSTVIESRLVIPPLTRLLADPAVEVRVEAARSLGPATSAAALSGADENLANAAIVGLIKSLDDQEPAVRIAAVYALGSIAASMNPSGVIDPQNLVAAMSTLLGDPDATVRAATIASFGVAGPAAAPDPPPGLIAALDDESSFNRAASVRALARFPKGSADRLIATVLGVLAKERHESPVRDACVETLHRIDPSYATPAALPAVRAGLLSHDRQVRIEAASLLKRLGLDARPALPE